jgi:hypothetical protein
MFVYYPEYLLCPNFQVSDINEELSRNDLENELEINENLDEKCCKEASEKQTN